MIRTALRQLGKRMPRRLLSWTVLLLSLQCAGCVNSALRGSSFFEDEWSTLPRTIRRAEDQTAPTAYSNKAAQIERNLGVQ